MQCPVLPMGPSPAWLSLQSREMLARKQSHDPGTQPQEPRRLRPAADRLTDVQVCLHPLAWHEAGAALRGRALPARLFIPQHMLAQHIKAAPICWIHFSPPLTLLSCLLQPSCLSAL